MFLVGRVRPVGIPDHHRMWRKRRREDYPKWECTEQYPSNTLTIGLRKIFAVRALCVRWYCPVECPALGRGLPGAGNTPRHEEFGNG